MEAMTAEDDDYNGKLFLLSFGTTGSLHITAVNVSHFLTTIATAAQVNVNGRICGWGVADATQS